MDKYEKAALDLISWAEGTLGVSQNGYDILYGYKRIIGWEPDTDIIHKWPTKATGRYQFKKPTWIETNNNINKPLTITNQDNACLKYIKIKLSSKYPEPRDVKLNQLENIEKFKIFMNKMAPSWASFTITKDLKWKGSIKKSGEGLYGEQKKEGGYKEFHRIYKKALNMY